MYQIVEQENRHFTSDTAVIYYNLSIEPGKMLVTTNVPNNVGDGSASYNTLTVSINRQMSDDQVFSLICEKLKELHVFGDVFFMRPPYIRRYI
jgi:hypothetical protein